MTGHVFDAAAVLGIGAHSAEPLPAPEAGFVTIRIPEGLSLQALRDSPVGQKLMHRQDWYEKSPWSATALPAGTYFLRLPVPGSGSKTAAEQEAILPAGEELAPAAVVAAALLCFKLQGGPDPLDNGWVRCAEQTVRGSRVELAWCGDRLGAGGAWGGGRVDDVFSASVRKVPS